MSKTTQCPKCHAALPRRGRFCLECGCDLYEEGIRHPPYHVIPIVVLVVAIGALFAYAMTRKSNPRKSVDETQVAELTQELLRLAAQRKAGDNSNYERIVSRFYKPNDKDYKRAADLLRDIMRDRGAPGLRIFRLNAMNDLDEARKFINKYPTDHPQYVTGLLAALTFADGALTTKLGTKFGTQRADDFVAWYLGLVFGPVEPKGAKITKVEWHHEPDAIPLLVATVEFPEPPKPLPPPVPGVADPRRLAWRRVGDGKWDLMLGVDSMFLLEEVINLLQRFVIE